MTGASGAGAPSASQKQKTLFGFFGKPVPGRAPTQASSSSATTSSDTPLCTQQQRNGASNGGQSRLPQPSSTSHMPTPPESSRKPIASHAESAASDAASSPLLNRHASTSKSSTQMLAAGRSGARPSTSAEMTPPSSSPPPASERDIDVRMSEADDDSQSTSGRTRRRAANKRVVSYIETDSEDEQPSTSRRKVRANVSSSADEDSDDADAYKPEANSKKGKGGRATRAAAFDSDDSEDDFIAPDDEELDALEASAQKKRKPPVAKSSNTSINSSRSAAGPSVLAARTNFLASSSSAPTSKQSAAKQGTEEPYEFLTHPLDENRNPPTHPDYDKRTLFIPQKTLDRLTPFEKQFWAIKKKHFDTVLFFQKGKFYELYEDDALIGHREFGLKLTDRVKMKMAGVPESSFTTCANKFLALGYKVGRVDQCETAVGMGMRKGAAASRSSPAEEDNSKIVRRELRHIYTNGTIVDADCLPDDMSSYCVSIKEVVRSAVTGEPVVDKDDESISAIPTFGICFLDAAIAKFELRHIVDDVSRTQFETLLRSLRIKEIVHEKGGLSKRSLRTLRNAVSPDCNITMLRPYTEFYDADQTMRKLNIMFNEELAERDVPQDIDSVEPVDPEILPPGIKQMIGNDEAVSALGGLLNYLAQLNLDRDICASRNFDIFDPLERQECMILDAQTLTHLNILTNEQGDTAGTLIGLVNRASTAFGKRLMKFWLLAPLAQIDAIVARQEAVEALLRDTSLQEEFDTFARSLPDIERIMPRIHAGNCKSRDFTRVLKALCRMDENMRHLVNVAEGLESAVVSSLVRNIPSVSREAQAIQDMYQDESFEPRRGCDEEYDQAANAVDEVERSLHRELAAAATLLKLPRDRVKFKDVGTNEIYQIEVPIKTKVPVEWQLVSQTQSVKRYYSAKIRTLVKELKEARETRVAALKAFQARLFELFREHGELFLKATKGIAELDCIISLAKASYAMGEPTCRPHFIESETAHLDFKDLRHPCLASTSTTEFIANDISLGLQGNTKGNGARVTVLTGGNMAGKSTTARTTATAVILAQLGCRVPAQQAIISPVDRIASRMGANDQLFRNNSTFMVEMLEASRIIRECTPRSLVVMDELGRGTSTFDGQAIAYAVLHHLISRTRCLCFFLTHYTMLAREFEGRFGVANKHMQVLVDGQRREVVFTYKLVPGIAESSYGTEVAELAGVPTLICERATLISREFADSMRQTEEERLAKLGNRLGVATLSDFSLIFRTGLKHNSNAATEGEVLDSTSLGYLRTQIAAVLASHADVKHTATIKEEAMPSVIEDEAHIASRMVRDSSPSRNLPPSLPAQNEMQEPSASKMTAKKSKAAAASQQRTLDFGQKVHIECRECGMSYDRRDAGDRNEHASFHLQRTHGIAWPHVATTTGTSSEGRMIGTHSLPKAVAKAYAASASALGTSRAKHHDCDSFLGLSEDNVRLLAFETGARAHLPSRALAGALAQAEEQSDAALGAVPLQLFGSDAEKATDTHATGNLKFLVAIYQQRVVGSALVGPIPTGSASRADVNSNGDVTISGEALPAQDTPVLGIYRIHVVPAVRRGHVASALLDAALEDCIYGMGARDIVARQGHGKHANVVAFSQPTQEGTALAEAWLRRRDSMPANERSGLIVFDER